MNVSELALADTISDEDFLNEMKMLLAMHMRHCEPFSRFVASIEDWDGFEGANELAGLPFLPVDVFKQYSLASVDESQLIKKIHSSGTTGSLVSQICLDQSTAQLMEQRLIKDTSNLIGSDRLPMYVVGERAMFTNRLSLRAREAAVAGLMKFGRPIRFLFSEGKLDETIYRELIGFRGQSLIVGTTVSAWVELLPILRSRRAKFLGQALIIHGGGWKKLQELNISANVFKESFLRHGDIRTINFYGMTEQLGAVSYECEFGNLHLPSCNRVVIRDPVGGFSLPFGSVGLIQQLSLLPRSYPGASILTDDLGMVVDGSNCRCSNTNHIIRVEGRFRKADIRGCGNVTG